MMNTDGIREAVEAGDTDMVIRLVRKSVLLDMAKKGLCVYSREESSVSVSADSWLAAKHPDIAVRSGMLALGYREHASHD